MPARPVRRSTIAAAPASIAAGSTGKTKQAEASAKLADGYYPVYLATLDVPARTLTVDVVQYFEGQAAVEAARQDNANADIGDDDYYIRNANPRLRTLAVDRNALIDLFVKANGDTTEAQLPELAAYHLKHPGTLFWINVRKGKAIYVYGGNA